MKIRKVQLILVLAVVLCSFLLFSCAVSDSSLPTDSKAESQPGTKQYRVGMILTGPITDVSWNGPQYQGLKDIEKTGASIAYQENIDVSGVVDALRAYGDEGFDVIFLGTNFYEETALPITKEYPDITFFIINGTTTEDNVYSFQVADEQQGFLMGVVSALVTKSNKVAFVGGREITPIMNGMKGFIQGVEYVNKEVEALTIFTGTSTDVTASKETAKALLDQGADVIAPMCDNAGLGVVEAAEEANAYAVASGKGQNDVAPNAVLVTVGKNNGIAVTAAYNSFVSGNLKDKTLRFGAAEGVIYLSDWYKSADYLDDDIKSNVQSIFEDLVNGTIQVDRD